MTFRLPPSELRTSDWDHNDNIDKPEGSRFVLETNWTNKANLTNRINRSEADAKKNTKWEMRWHQVKNQEPSSKVG